MGKTKDTLTDEDFELYGMNACPTLSELALLSSDDIEILIYALNSDGLIPTVNETFYKSEIYWAISPNNVDWFIYRDGSWKETTLESFVDEEFTRDEIAQIPRTAWEFLGKGYFYFKSCFISNMSGVQPAITSIIVTTPTSYMTGSEAIFSVDDISLNTEMWLTITNVEAIYEKPEGTNIFFLFSIDNKISWKTLNGEAWVTSNISDISRNGIPISSLATIRPAVWKNLIPYPHLDIAIGLYSENSAVTPSISQVIFNHTEYEARTVSNIITINTPSVPYKRMIIGPEYTYIEEEAEGIGFDDRSIENYWYTTPNKIHLRVFGLPSQVGTKTSEYFICKVRNTFESMDVDAVLTARMVGKDGKIHEATPYESMGYGLLPDSNIENERTKIEFSRDGKSNSQTLYPLRFVLYHKGSSEGPAERLFYFRITPTVTTVGKVSAEIVVTYTEHTKPNKEV